jgi:uncharacterized NAD-dependent epimerase/dehydratase family protein
MTQLTHVQLKAPYLILIGDVPDPTSAKTGLGIVQWRRERVAGQLRFANCNVDLGVPDLSIPEAVEAGVKSLVIGVAPTGGAMPDSWWAAIEEAAQAGLDIVCGLHIKLSDRPTLVTAAQNSGAELIDVRTPPTSLPIGTDRKRSGKRLLMVGTDCAVGKKYTALALSQCMNNSGLNATFRATGQTGIMLAGEGIPIDSVVADFISGAAEMISPDNSADHWDVIEGQGSLLHPGYSGVSLGLLHGSQPDAFVVCHEAGRTMSDEGHRLRSIAECIEIHTVAGRLTNPDIHCVGISVNTSTLPEQERSDYLARLSNETGLPCVDPLGGGCDAIVENLTQRFPEYSENSV